MATISAPKVTWDNKRIKQDRIALLQAEMKREGVGALYLGSGVSARYALNLKVPGCNLFIPAQGEVIAFARPRDEGLVASQHDNMRPPLTKGEPGTKVRGGDGVFARGLAAVMGEYGLAGEKLGIQDIRMGSVLELVGAGFNLVDAEPIIEHTWSVKTDDEVEIYRLIGELYVTTFNSFRDAIHPGVTEKALAHVITSTWEELGVEDISQLNVCSGENMNPWRRWPSDRAVQAGDFVGADMHARGPLGLRGDGSTTFLVGDSPTDEQRDLYRRAYDYLQTTTPLWRGGRAIADVMADFPQVPERFKKKLWDLNYGHGCGLGSSGYPHLNPRLDPIDDTLKKNQIYALEVFFGEVGNPQAVKLEQMVLIRDGEPELLGITPMDERLFR
ncbi:MAG: peptidase [Chloroflexi bacterium]|nr:peptidase [Chloroflexota bacterium]